MSRKKHSKKEIEAALAHAESKGWRIEEGGKSAHCWGRLYCPYNNDECRCGEFCITSVWSTPKSEMTHSRQIRRTVDKCVKLIEHENNQEPENE